jgi:predicted ATPase/DNA-binding SARP family transcriptional activator/peroxiredoxin
MRIEILGPLQVWEDGRELAVGSGRQRALFALLLLHAGETVSIDRLIDDLWPAHPPATAAKVVQVYVSRLRRALPASTIETRGSAYILRAEDTDAAEFERLVDLARDQAPRERTRLLRTAVALWRGAPLADVECETWAQTEIGRLLELKLAALEERIDADLELGFHARVVPELEALLAEHPLRERLRAQLMLALYRSGRQAEALQVYARGRKQLVEELGIEPGAELQELQRNILNQDAALAAAPGSRPEPAESALPAAANPLIGRKHELRELGDLLVDGARLVTVSGAGGSGKTRLALELAATLERDLGHRVHFVPLAPARRPELLAETIMAALAIESLADEPSFVTLKRHLQGRPTLLVLDNFEHLLEAGPLLAELLAGCPQLKVLVTSRAPLHLSGEHEYPLDPLPLVEAIALFRERVRAVRPEFAADEALLAAICGRLDRLPLALELAAVHSRLLSAEELLGRLENRLELLTGGARDLPSRQQTLRATIQWSYELLDVGEQQLFARLAVFSGGCTLEAAERICDATIEQLESLVDMNLVRRHETAGESRFWMLETIREFALEQLEASEGVEGACRSYADYYLALARRRVADHDRGQGTALDALERELDNIRSAFAWTHELDVVPVPIDDGACDHLPGIAFPSCVLDSSQGPLDLADLAATQLVLYVYPGTTKPGQPMLPGLSEMPGGVGCTPQSRAFRDLAAELAASGARVAGLSVQNLADQLEFAQANEMPFPLLADPDRRMGAALKLPTFEVAGRVLYRRVTLVIEQSRVVKVFYPVFPPERNAQEVVAWLSEHAPA